MFNPVQRPMGLPMAQVEMPVRFGARKKSDAAKRPNVGQPAQDQVQITGGADPNAVKYVKMTRPNPTVFDNVPINGTEVVVFDLETTGLYPKPDSRLAPGEALDDIIEISAMRVKDGKMLSQFRRVVKPNKPLSAGN